MNELATVLMEAILTQWPSAAEHRDVYAEWLGQSIADTAQDFEVGYVGRMPVFKLVHESAWPLAQRTREWGGAKAEDLLVTGPAGDELDGVRLPVAGVWRIRRTVED